MNKANLKKLIKEEVLAELKNKSKLTETVDDQSATALFGKIKTQIAMLNRAITKPKELAFLMAGLIKAVAANESFGPALANNMNYKYALNYLNKLAGDLAKDQGDQPDQQKGQPPQQPPQGQPQQQQQQVPPAPKQPTMQQQGPTK